MIPYWRLSGYYFFYFAFVGAFSPYFSLYLQSIGNPPKFSRVARRVARIEVQRYSHSQRHLLAVTVDAAIKEPLLR